MRILIACESSGVAWKAFNDRGHNVISCDLLPSELSTMHHQGDIGDMLCQDWDMIVAFPPCTYLSNAGVCWLAGGGEKQLYRWHEMIKACIFFNLFVNHPCEKICIENPVQHGYARRFIRKYDQIVSPHQFGHEHTKRTCLWLKGLPNLKPTKIVDKGKQYVYPDGRRTGAFCALMPGNKDQSKNRSRTFPGIAAAMAEKWG